MFVVLATNTSHDDTIYGPFKSLEKAQSAAATMSGDDHLHEYHVMEVEKVPEAEEE